ncbi:phage head closure protein [Caloramator sp. Dgby_cultured_2]|uniref:phage head closure protein n=1 Tax=Caloramator sp. Dgby_cultured_2 TaxID=3029174 RepID=UPI00237D9A9C|nr:phage head closure protein [Caloramator sp. Dgby_cultured_2]WDU84211.1 phage head closure protein [Caloramator sp. Dgby_cultured_2]
MKIGDLRHRITFQKYISTIDEEGFATQEWQDIASVWAAVKNLYGREYWEAAAIQAENTVKFTIRYRNDIDNTMRIKFNNKYYNIIFIDNIKYQNKFIEIKAQEVI